jgi:integrase/recombinase XerD
VEDIDFARGTVTILHLKKRISLSCPKCKSRLGRRHHFCPECGEEVDEVAMRQQEHRRVRTLPLDSETLDMLASFTRQQDRNGVIFGVNRHRAWQIVRECAKRAGLPDLVNPETGKMRGVSPHRLRDAFAVHAVKLDDSGDGLRLLQEHLGHASFNTTAKYRKVAGEEQREWYERLWHGTVKKTVQPGDQFFLTWHKAAGVRSGRPVSTKGRGITKAKAAVQLGLF